MSKLEISEVEKQERLKVMRGKAQKLKETSAPLAKPVMSEAEKHSRTQKLHEQVPVILAENKALKEVSFASLKEMDAKLNRLLEKLDKNADLEKEVLTKLSKTYL